jgi:hypothetical protein
MPFILTIKLLLRASVPAGIGLALAGTADEWSQRMNENDQRVAELFPNETDTSGFSDSVRDPTP